MVPVCTAASKSRPTVAQTCIALQAKFRRGVLKTPEKFKNSKCGLSNIQNDDNQCFKYCLVYHQSKQGSRDDRVSVFFF